ncbi:MAG: hypothetical protein L6R39_001124 [Caloplaca ligustica]|nr:MAG: hypothetical protein L6R39_001124 [Caloplaca ligustica]
MSISTSLYHTWTDATHIAITRNQVQRRIPFPSFLYTTRPALLPGGSLTPFKLGIAYCWTLENLLIQTAWPGYVLIEVFEAARKLGSVEIQNSPQAGAVPPRRPDYQELGTILSAKKTSNVRDRPSDHARSRSSVRMVADDWERRWFTCVAKFLFYIVRNSVSASVTDEMPGPMPGKMTETYRYACMPNHPNFKDLVVITIFPTAAQLQYRLTWNDLAKGLLVFGTKVAERQGGWDTMEFVLVNGVPVATLEIALGTRTGSATA